MAAAFAGSALAGCTHTVGHRPVAGSAPSESRPVRLQWPWQGGRPAQSDPERIAKAPTISDIVRVLPFYDLAPWLTHPEAESFKPLGIRIRSLFLISDKTQKGVFGDGTLRMVLYRIRREPGEPPIRQKVHEWSFDPEQAVPYRVAKETFLGYGYQFDLVWPEDLQLGGSELALVIEYLRSDGKVVRADPKYFKVLPGM
jgi:hypothetical protein